MLAKVENSPWILFVLRIVRNNQYLYFAKSSPKLDLVEWSVVTPQVFSTSLIVGMKNIVITLAASKMVKLNKAEYHWVTRNILYRYISQ